jgi:hypothetical protein
MKSQACLVIRKHVQQCLQLVCRNKTEPALNLFTLLLAWAVTEVVRYSFYAVKLVHKSPAALTWVRYTAFIVLYPLGVSSELAMIWLALPRIKALHLCEYPMPNPVNMSFSFYWACIFIALCYAPGLPCLSLHQPYPCAGLHVLKLLLKMKPGLQC